MATIDLGAPGTPCRLDVGELIGTRLLVTGNSGAGKSRLLRRLIEQAAGKVQTIIIDPEGEYATLREKHDFMLAGSRGEVPADPRSAALLARRIMELRVSAVLDIYQLRWPDRRAFVRNFLESLMSLDKAVYRQALVAIDEAHMFCPEGTGGDDVAAESVIALQSQGRKRGLGGMLATQRFSKLHKDASAECNNVFIGRTWQDVDQKRAGDLLGISKADRGALRDLGAGVFYAFGPALETAGHRGIIQFQAGDVLTTHPKAGQAFRLEPPAPSEKIKAVADQLQDLPAQAEEEIKTFDAAKAKIRALEREVRAAWAAQPPPPPAPKAPKKVEVPAVSPAMAKNLEVAVWRAEKLANDMSVIVDDLGQLSSMFKEAAAGVRQGLAAAVAPPPTITTPVNVSRELLPPARPVPARERSNNGSAPIGGLRRMLVALYDRREGLTRGQLGARAGLASRHGTFRTYLSRGRTEGWIVEEGHRILITEAGVAALGDKIETLPHGQGLRNFWLGQLTGKAVDMLTAICQVYPESITRQQIGEAVSIAHEHGTFRTYLSKLRTLELVHVVGQGELKASAELFD